jgi:hypothetical protein
VDEKRAGFEAFGGVEIRLGERTLRPPAFTVAETSRWLHMLDSLAAEGVDPVDALHTIEASVREFGERIGLGDVPLRDLGVEHPATFGEAIALLDLLHDAQWHESIVKRSMAQVKWLDQAPAFFDVDADALDAPALFEMGAVFATDIYLHIYGLAQDFFSRLAVGPRATTWTMDLPSPSTSAPGSPT